MLLIVIVDDKEKDKFEDLHKSILACDEVLKSVETYLTNFQADLGAVSAEIESPAKACQSYCSTESVTLETVDSDANRTLHSDRTESRLRNTFRAEVMHKSL